jgi:hypothetical protein
MRWLVIRRTVDGFLEGVEAVARPLGNRRERALSAQGIAACGGHREAPAKKVATM